MGSQWGQQNPAEIFKAPSNLRHSMILWEIPQSQAVAAVRALQILRSKASLQGFPTLGAGLPRSPSAARNWETQLSSAPQQQKQLPNVGTNQGLSAQCIKTVFRQQILFSSANFFLDFYPAEDSLLCSDHISPIRWGTRQRSLRWHF